MHKKRITLCVLLAVFAVVSITAVLVSRHEEKVEQIKNSGETILTVPTGTVTALSWTNGEGTFSFTKDGTWTYDGDAAFPVDAEKINGLLEQFAFFAAAFTIEDVDDYAQYGLDEPVCTINITVGEESYTIKLGDFSKMDEQRYVSIGNGKAYLVEHDPLDEFDAVLRDMILNDTIPDFDTADEITFSGSENYTVLRDEDGKSICEDDVYFTDGKPLDTGNVNTWLSALSSLSLTDYVSYNVSEEELQTFGLNEPDLTVALSYSSAVEDGDETDSGTLTLHLSQNPEERAAYEEALASEEEELPDVTCYARVGDSQIVYQISEYEYNELTAVSYDTLRHQKLFTADFDSVTSMDVTLDGERYTFTYTPPEDTDDEDAAGTWTYNGEEFDVYDLRTALRAVSASSFTEETPAGQEEISLTVHLDNEDFPTFTLTLYRYDGANCIAAIDGKTAAFVPRSQTVDLIEAVNKLTLGS